MNMTLQYKVRRKIHMTFGRVTMTTSKILGIREDRDRV